MSTLTSNILTITEPTIALDPFEIQDIESGNQGEDSKDRTKQNNPNMSKVAGGAYPAIRINKYDFNQNDIVLFELNLDEFLPQLRVTVNDSRGKFNLSQYPKDGDTLMLYIRSTDEEVYKPIRMDFDILNVDAPAMSNASNAAPAENESNPALTPVTYSFECRMKIPGLFTEKCKGYASNTSFNHFEEVATELSIGFASNVEDTDDPMPRICAYDTVYSFLQDNIKTAYKDDNSFFIACVDPYYYLNYVDLNNQLKYDEELEDSLVSFVNDMSDADNFTGESAINETKLYITNIEKNHTGTDKYILAHSLQNNAAQVTSSGGYRRTIQYYDDNSREYRQFTIDPLTTENLPEDMQPLRGRLDEDRYQNEVKFKYMGKQGDEHDNYLYAQIHNYQNLQELNKMYLTVEMDKANMSFYRFQRLPVIIYETDSSRIEVMKKREELNRDEGVPPSEDKGEQGDAIKEMYGAPKLNKMLTGVYVIGAIEYTYNRGAKAIKQKLTLLRREWPHPI